VDVFSGVSLLPAAMHAAQSAGIYSEADFEGRHVATMGVKFGTEEGWHGGGDPTKFHPYRCSAKGIGPPKLKFLLRFDQNVEYKRHAAAFPFIDFHEICRFVPRFETR